MDSRFVATPNEADVADALRLWPELTGRHVRPLLVSAFGDIFVETDAGDAWVASPIDLTCTRVAASTQELERLFADPAWAEEHLLTELALFADESGMDRPRHQVFAVAPHPRITGSLRVEQLMPMDLRVWHDIAIQIRARIGETAPGPPSQRPDPQ
jgi:hypothetical protein